MDAGQRRDRAGGAEQMEARPDRSVEPVAALEWRQHAGDVGDHGVERPRA